MSTSLVKGLLSNFLAKSKALSFLGKAVVLKCLAVLVQNEAPATVWTDLAKMNPQELSHLLDCQTPHGA